VLSFSNYEHVSNAFPNLIIGNSGAKYAFEKEGDHLVFIKYIYFQSEKNKLSIIESLKFQNSHIVPRSGMYEVPYQTFFCGGDYVEIRMPFIRGISGSDIVCRSNIRQIKIIEDLFMFESTVIESRSLKLRQIRSVADEKFMYILDEFQSLIGKSVLLGQRSNEKFIHGDLTLSNVILDGQRLYLIDFLVGYTDRLEVDVSKILQEIRYGWSLRYTTDHRAISRAHAVYKYFRKVYKSAIASTNLSALAEVECFITIARIIPYIRDEVTYSWTYDALSSQLGFVKRGLNI
jgi:hypothetical protein